MDFNNTSDFVSGFWNMYVIVLALVSILGCGVFLLIQDKASTNAGQTTGHVWDETLEEYNNPLPNWWRWMFYITIVFALVYLALYPGLGNLPGKFGWSMRGQYDAEMKAADAKYGPIFQKYQNMDVKAVAANPEAKEMGQRLFLTYCASCHGSDAKGAKGFPNLTDKNWLWGGTPEKIEATITNGHDNLMPAKGLKPDMDGEQIKDVVAYVRSLAGLTHDSIRAQRGKDIFPTACAACHGPEGKGNPDAGYPNLTVSNPGSRLYGATEESMIETVTKGRVNKMPAWGDFLGPAKVHLLTAYVWGLGGGEEPKAAAPAPAPEAAPAGMEGMSGMSSDMAAAPADKK
jgi:cytochrome c oxidase cbb3-type subunit 3